MRITTQMLNETAKRTGIPINHTSLLNYINDSGSSGDNTLLDALNKNDKVSSAATANYKKLEKSADNLKEQAEKLAQTGEGSFWDKIKESANTEELCKTVEHYVSNYNTTLRELKKSPGVLNQYYGEMLRDTALENSEQLSALGITIGKDGALSIDAEKLKAASVDDVEKVFGASGSLTSKTAFIAGKISDNAQANMESVSGQYNASGNLYAQLASKFDYFG